MFDHFEQAFNSLRRVHTLVLIVLIFLCALEFPAANICSGDSHIFAVRRVTASHILVIGGMGDWSTVLITNTATAEKLNEHAMSG